MNNELTEVRMLLSFRSNLSDELWLAASLAKILKATLLGVFLEEEDLICAAELSISSDISRWSAKEKEISSDSVKRALRTYAKHQKRELKRIAEKEKIEYGFDVVRGEPYSWILEELKSHRIVFVAHQNVSRNNFSNFNDGRLDYSRFNKAVTSVKNKDPVKVIFSGSGASKRALEIAIQIVLLNHRALTVLLDAVTFESEMSLREKLNDFLSEYLSKQLEIHQNININAERFSTHHNVKSLSHKLYMLVYPVENNEFQLLPQLLKHLQCPLVLVR